MSIQVAVDVPSSPYVNMEDFKKQIADYARILYVRMSAQNAPSASKMKPLEQLSPVLQELCGICSVAEEDLNGDVARTEALRNV